MNPDVVRRRSEPRHDLRGRTLATALSLPVVLVAATVLLVGFWALLTLSMIVALLACAALTPLPVLQTRICDHIFIFAPRNRGEKMQALSSRICGRLRRVGGGDTQAATGIFSAREAHHPRRPGLPYGTSSGNTGT